MKIERPISGETVRIRSYTPEDLPFVSSMWFDEENGKYMSDPTTEFIDEVFQQAIDQLADSKLGYYFIVEQASSGEKIGSCCAFPNEDQTVYEIGYCVHKRHWQKGYGTDIVNALERWIFEQGAVRITAEVAMENVPSNALLKKLGYQAERETQFEKYHMGIIYPSFVYAKTR